MQVTKTLLAIVFVAMFSVQAVAETASSKGIANISLEGPLTPELKQQALREASINALDRYFAKTNQAKAKNYELARDGIVRSIDNYVLSATVLSEDIDGKPLPEDGVVQGGLYSIVIRADINTNRLNNELKSQSVIANTASADKSLLTFVFVAREQNSIQAFDDKIYKRTDVKGDGNVNVSTFRDSKESEDIRANSIALQEGTDYSLNMNENTSVVTTTGGSTTSKSDVITWKVTRAAEVNSVMTGIFSNAGYEVIEAGYLEEESGGLVNLEKIRGDYQTGDDVSSETMRNTAKGVRLLEIPFLALGTLDIGMKSTDPVTGLVRVYVTVTGKVLNVSGRFPRTVSSVGPVQVAGLGPTETVARTNALKQAAETAALQLTDELNAKGVQ